MKKLLEVVALALVGGDSLWLIVNFNEEDVYVRLWAGFIFLCIGVLAVLCARWSERYSQAPKSART